MHLDFKYHTRISVRNIGKTLKSIYLTVVLGAQKNRLQFGKLDKTIPSINFSAIT